MRCVAEFMALAAILAHEHEFADRHVATDLFAALPQQCFMERLAIVLTAAGQNKVGARVVAACDGQQAAIADDDRFGGVADECHASTRSCHEVSECANRARSCALYLNLPSDPVPPSP